MNIHWQINPEDITKVRSFLDQHRDTPFVKMRIARNLRDEKPPVTKADFWRVMVGCLITTQQRSGPDTPVSQFLLAEPFPLTFEICAQQEDVAPFATKVLTGFGGLRRANTIGNELAANLSYLESGGWEPTFEQLENVRLNSKPDTERRAADFIDNHYKGFGPKQSRNLLQWLGLSRFEIPIDSRITKWLNEFGFPVKLTAGPLQDVNYYNFVSDGVQRLAEAADVMPCILDAAIFSSFDGDGWTKETMVYCVIPEGTSESGMLTD